jgi:hypothetical protein
MITTVHHINSTYAPPFVYTQTGGTVSTSSGYTYLTFTSSGTFTVTSGGLKTIYYLLVGGGAVAVVLEGELIYMLDVVEEVVECPMVH